MLKPLLKYFIYRFHLAEISDRLVYHFRRYLNRKANLAYRYAFPGMPIPPDHHLHTTYQVHYRQFIEDGQLAASEIIQWTKPYTGSDAPAILDWGCGVGRIIRHLPGIIPNALLYGCDINEAHIQWNKTHHPAISFTLINNFTPTLYAPGFFDMVYGISILTHIDASQQAAWIEELHRMLKKNGVLLVSTQGRYYNRQLLPWERKKMREKGIFTKAFSKHGHRMMSTYHAETFFRKLIVPYFLVLEYYDGAAHFNRLGGQDLWILAKR